MEQRLWVPGPLPGMNEIVGSAKGFRGKGTGYSVMKHCWTSRVALLARKAGLSPVASAAFMFKWFELTRRRDPDNIVAAKKFILDGLVMARVLKDDGQDEVASFSDSWEVGAPGCLVTIREVS